MKIDLTKLAAATTAAANKASASAKPTQRVSVLAARQQAESVIAEAAFVASETTREDDLLTQRTEPKPATQPTKPTAKPTNANTANLAALLGALNTTKPINKPVAPTEPIEPTEPTEPTTPQEYLGERAQQRTLTLEDLDPSQRAAIDLLATYSRGVMVGSAGTGKSTTQNLFLERIMPEIPEVMLSQVRNLGEDAPPSERMRKVPAIAAVSYTGIATQRLATKLPEELQRNCMTIHRLLGYYPEIEEYIDEDTHEIKARQIFVPFYTEHNPLQWDTIIIDEAGMVPAELWNNLCAALLPTTRVYLVGDIAQLPPIMGTSPLTIAMRDLPTAELTHVHRTENDWITQSAQRIRNGLMPDFDTPVTKFQTLDPYPDRAAQQIVAGVIKLYRDGKFDPATDAVITATNVNDLGQENLNRKLCKHFNPDSEQIRINAILSRPRYAIGDKIMVTKNDDNAGLANGMIGYITDIQPNSKFQGNVTVDFAKLATMDIDNEDSIANISKTEDAASQSMQASHILTATFPDCYANNPEVKFSTGNSYSNIQHAYAITCHKAQGGEFRQVIVITHSASGRMLNREWFYTAWTRAKRNIIVLGNIGGMNKCINNQQLKGKTAKEKVAHATAKIDHKLRQANKLNDPAAVAKIMASIPQVLTTERIG